LQFIALLLLDVKLPVFNGSESSKLKRRISQEAKKPGGETAKGGNSQTPTVIWWMVCSWVCGL